MHSAGFEPAIPEIERPQTYILGRNTPGTRDTFKSIYTETYRYIFTLFIIEHCSQNICFVNLEVTVGVTCRNVQDERIFLISFAFFVNNQFHAQFRLNTFIYSSSLQVSRNQVLIIRRVNCTNATSGYVTVCR